MNKQILKLNYGILSGIINSKNINEDCKN